MKPLVALPAQTETDPRSYAMRIRYIDYLSRAGAMTVIVPPTACAADLAATLDRCDGLCLVGGPDIWPELYGAQAPEDTTPYHRLRDESEIALARHAFEIGMPVLGICRGMQAINVALGGTLHEDVRAHDDGAHWLADRNEDPIFPAHEAVFAEGSFLERMLGVHSVPVNSMHHQAIARCGEGLVPDAFGPGANLPDHGETPIIEAIHHPARRFFMGVQWHPEYCPDDAPSIRLAEAFVGACEEYRRERNQGDDL